MTRMFGKKMESYQRKQKNLFRIKNEISQNNERLLALRVNCRRSKKFHDNEFTDEDYFEICRKLSQEVTL